VTLTLDLNQPFYKKSKKLPRHSSDVGLGFLKSIELIGQIIAQFDLKGQTSQGTVISKENYQLIPETNPIFLRNLRACWSWSIELHFNYLFLNKEKKILNTVCVQF